MKKDFEKCREIVKEVIAPEKYTLSERELDLLTKEIMTTCELAGGDCSAENTRFFTQAYIRQGFIVRFKRAHEHDGG